MKLLIIRLTVIVGLAVILVLILNSCTKDKEEVINYAGKWEFSNGDIKSVFLLEQNTFETQSLFKQDDNSMYVYAKSMGDLKIINDSLDMTIIRMEVDTSFTKRRVPDGYLTIYKREDIQFTDDTEKLWHIRYGFEIQGDKMILHTEDYDYEYHRVP